MLPHYIVLCSKGIFRLLLSLSVSFLQNKHQVLYLQIKQFCRNDSTLLLKEVLSKRKYFAPWREFLLSRRKEFVTGKALFRRGSVYLNVPGSHKICLLWKILKKKIHPVNFDKLPLNQQTFPW